MKKKRKKKKKEFLLFYHVGLGSSSMTILGVKTEKNWWGQLIFIIFNVCRYYYAVDSEVALTHLAIVWEARVTELVM